MAFRVVRADDPADSAFPGLSQAQFGAVAEERLATAITVQAGGSASVGFPLLDLGFDLYLRRVRTLRVHPVQIKARSFLEADGQFAVGVKSLHLDPVGYIAFPFIPPPGWELTTAFWAIPIPDFVKFARPHQGGYVFTDYLDGRLGSPANAYLVPVDRIQTHWLHRIPGWTAPVHRSAEGLIEPAEGVPKRSARAFGKFGELWLASQLMRECLDSVVVAQDRLRVDCVDLILHDLQSFLFRGLVVHTGTVSATKGVVEFRIRADTFFLDERLDVVCIPCQPSGELAQTSFVIPSGDLEAIATTSHDYGMGDYMLSFRLNPLAEKMGPYAVPTSQLAARIVKRLRMPEPR